MAKRTAVGAKTLVIVESPAKARTISKFLGSNYTVEASIGHIRDLPEGAKDVPAEFKGQSWARLGVNVDENFEPIYVVPDKKKPQVTKLKQLLKESGELLLATDEEIRNQLLFAVLRATQAEAEAAGITDEDVEQELAAHKAERRDRREHDRQRGAA